MPLLTIKVKDASDNIQTICESKDVESVQDAMAIVDPLTVAMIQLGTEDGLVWSITSSNATGAGETLTFED